MKITIETNNFEMTELSEAIRQFEIELSRRIERWEEINKKNPSKVHEKYIKILNKRLEDLVNVSCKLGQAELKSSMF